MLDKSRDLLPKMKALADVYTPEWKFNPDAPDAGSVVALLYKNMLEDSIRRYDMAFHKHKIQYLNLFDSFKVEPIEAARSYVKFIPVVGTSEPVHIPRGTQLLADADADNQIVFETAHGITVGGANIQSIISTGKGKICPLYEDEKENAHEKLNLTAFDTSGRNLENHSLILGFKTAFDYLDRLHIGIAFSCPNKEQHEKNMLAFMSSDVSFMLDGETDTAFDSVTRDGDIIWLTKKQYIAEKTPLSDGEYHIIKISASKLCTVEISGIEVGFSGGEIVPDVVVCNGVMQNPGHFLPFGTPLSVYAECAVDSMAVFARAGAHVNMSFDLAFNVVEEHLPEYEIDTEYKVIMRKEPKERRLQMVDIRPDEVLIEYLSITGWKRLLFDEASSKLFNGNTSGHIDVDFTMPDDMISPDGAGSQPRLRMRLMRADNLYRVPNRQYCPVMTGIKFAYSYETSKIVPDFIFTENNFERIDLQPIFENSDSAQLFYSNETDKPAMYMGFDKNPEGSPASLYFCIENMLDSPVDFTVEYLSYRGFEPVKVVDQTGRMTCSGTMLMMIPSDIVKKSMYGNELFWIRMLSHDRDRKAGSMPIITGIFQNMVKVENVKTRTEYFYIGDEDGALDITLGEQHLITVKVYVNEQSREDEDEDNWVLWQPSGVQGIGRSYYVDLNTGMVSFRKNIFSVYLVKQDRPAIKIMYQGYHGALANVKSGAISTMVSSVKQISAATNPFPAFGGYDGYNEETSAQIISNMLRTRNRAVTEQDYYDIISQISYGVRQIKCYSGITASGEKEEDALTLAVLLDDFDMGGQIFSTAKDEIRKKLLDCSGLSLVGKSLHLTQPRFVRMSVRLWISCESMENAYDIQKESIDHISRFLDPLQGGFEQQGWRIGVLPSVPRLIAYLKIKQPGIVVTKAIMTAKYENHEYDMSKTNLLPEAGPFAMAVSGEHVAYIDLYSDDAGIDK